MVILYLEAKVMLDLILQVVVVFPLQIPLKAEIVDFRKLAGHKLLVELALQFFDLEDRIDVNFIVLVVLFDLIAMLVAGDRLATAKHLLPCLFELQVNVRFAAP